MAIRPNLLNRNVTFFELFVKLTHLMNRKIRTYAPLFLIFSSMFFMRASAANPRRHAFGVPSMVQQVPKRIYHVKNYRLGLRFDELKGEVFGDEVITLRPLASGFQRFYLDSSGLKIGTVTLDLMDGRKIPLRFEVKGPHLWIRLNRTYNAGDVLKVRILYHGNPQAGLYFVNPTPDYPNWPREIWSQGEPQFNHFWFPCWDYPNDLSTSETIVTVPNGQRVVSNGRLVSVIRHGALTTYDWVESVPHSSYLTSIAVGTWKEVIDHDGSLPVDYYVPQTISVARARRSFHLTPDMIRFYSKAFGVPYPYEKYAQVVVKNYLFGGMENVSATTLTDAILHGTHDEPEYTSQTVVAHELGQHWFGDFVQGRDWADIWLNEGFATYLEALYTQYHNGNDAFRYEMWQNQLAAEQQDREDYLRPIVDDHYRYPLQMFDSITHEKGAAVLDMLRHVLDASCAVSRPASQHELLFRALKVYLIRYRTHAVDTANLESTLEAVTGRHLGWFFREWVFMAGSPHYRVTARYDPHRHVEWVKVSQIQRGKGVPRVFRMPVELAFYSADGQARFIRVLNQQRTQIFRIALGFKPEWVDFDPHDIIEKRLDFTQPDAALIAKAVDDPAMMGRLSAVDQLARTKGADTHEAVSVLIRVLNHDAFYGVRIHAAESLGRLHTTKAKAALLRGLSEQDSRVRVAVVHALAALPKDRSVYEALVHVFHRDPSNAVKAAAAEGIGAFGGHAAAAVLLAAAKPGTDIHLMQGLLRGLAATGDPRAIKLILNYARAVVAEQLRIDALQTLAGMHVLNDRERHALLDVARAALNDTYLRTQFAGETLAGAQHFVQLRPQITVQAKTAPTAFQRAEARAALNALSR